MRGAGVRASGRAMLSGEESRLSVQEQGVTHAFAQGLVQAFCHWSAITVSSAKRNGDWKVFALSAADRALRELQEKGAVRGYFFFS